MFEKFKILCKSSSSLRNTSGLISVFRHYHDGILRSSYCHLEVDYSVNSMKKLFNRVQG